MLGTVGVPMSVTLHNTLTDNVGLSIPHLDGFASDVTGVATGDSTTYNFTPQRPGTYTYQAALTEMGTRQVAMGLVGALVVRPATTATAYDAAQSGAAVAGAWDDEAVIVYTDVDSKLAAAPTTYNMRDYRPDYHLINGLAYPDGPSIATGHGRTVMVRVVNGSILEKSPTILGDNFNVIARGARALDAPLSVSGRTVNPGDTFDANVVMPAVDTRYSIYDAPGNLRNGGWLNGANSPAIGGAITFIDSGALAGASLFGPAVKLLAATGAPGDLSVSATFDTVGRSGANVLTAEYYIDNAVRHADGHHGIHPDRADASRSPGRSSPARSAAASTRCGSAGPTRSASARSPR